MRTLLSRIAGFIRRARLDRRLDDEVRFHIDMLARAHERRGASRQDGRAAACREFAGILIGVAVLASLLPALRAIRLNPVAALRQN